MRPTLARRGFACEREALVHAEAVLFVHDREAEACKDHIVLEQSVRADDKPGLTAGDAGKRVSSFASGPGSSTLPMVVFSKVRLGVSPEINVLATITITVVTLIMIGVAWWMARAARLEKAGAKAAGARAGA